VFVGNFRYNFNLEFFIRFWCVLLVSVPGWQSVTALQFVLLICLVLLGVFCYVLLKDIVVVLRLEVMENN